MNKLNWTAKTHGRWIAETPKMFFGINGNQENGTFTCVAAYYSNGKENKPTTTGTITGTMEHCKQKAENLAKLQGELEQ